MLTIIFLYAWCGAGDSSAVLFEFLYYVQRARAFYYGSEVLCDVVYTRSYEHLNIHTLTTQNLNSAVFVYVQRGYIPESVIKWKVEVVDGGDIHVNWFCIWHARRSNRELRALLLSIMVFCSLLSKNFFLYFSLKAYSRTMSKNISEFHFPK